MNPPSSMKSNKFNEAKKKAAQLGIDLKSLTAPIALYEHLRVWGYVWDGTQWKRRK